MVIKSDTHHLYAHKIVLAQQSKYFLRAFLGNFSVAPSPVIDPGDEDDPSLVMDMIQYMYCYGDVHYNTKN
ncbi:unnamed protein product [Aureobasidium pullulans]|jgi:hypothetical protein|nr:unnamed protein product [Aureobasidium pullulans]